ncbi:tripartite tricarboxylate transporter substrate binding protein [Roseomonas hellenica]|uniref:Tripartite tricarboxylate transporter substrate binding protein n=1 Tax=Plastoroseomonas hellenica TaxID=2687306 RepID=A0ABS5ERU9_9PROT|nr:tripartite tricarboxylate transporter substrate binding protein [Plastoroseomonas hellenica]MBR0662963.1 tripartite tricarboxylate transporter substrate binding protein [Plastoroseomonas hellenica]
MKRLLVAALALLSLGSLPAGAFPDRPPRILGGFAAGGTSDIVNRLLAEAVAPHLGLRPVVEVRTGANGFIAAEAAARSAPDGHTVVQCATGLLTVTPNLPGAQLPIDPARDLVPIANIVHSTQAMVVAARSPYRSVAEVLAAARARPGTITYASAGIGSVSHLSGARLAQLGGLDLVHVPYRGAAPGVLDVAAGRTDLIITNLGDVAGQIGEGLRLLAFADGIGSPRYAGTGQVSDALPGYAVSGWFGLCGPRGMPEPVITRWVEAIRAGFADAAIRQRLQENGLTLRLEDSAGFARTIEQDSRLWREVIRAASIRVE